MDRELLVLFGHSGSGKSLTLRAVAGLLGPDRGRIEIDDTSVFDSELRVNVPPQRRGVGLMVQDYALFPHLTVRENIAFGLHGRPRTFREGRVTELARLLQIDELLDRRPRQLSGGQGQRVALARALAPGPRLLLLDEPFAALDSAIRVTLRRELGRLKRELDLTIVFVTHDLREAYNLADRIAVFDQGQVLQSGPRDDVFQRPASARVAELTEVRNIWRGRVLDVDTAGVLVETQRFRVRAAPAAIRVGEEVAVCIRPERVLLVRPERAPEENAARDTLLAGSIVDEIAHGASHTLFVRLGDGPANAPHDIEVDVAAHPYTILGVRERRDWSLALPREAVHVMPAG